jgi:hypothetical protein
LAILSPHQVISRWMFENERSARPIGPYHLHGCKLALHGTFPFIIYDLGDRRAMARSGLWPSQDGGSPVGKANGMLGETETCMTTFSTLWASFGSSGGVKACLLEFFWQCPDVSSLKYCFLHRSASLAGLEMVVLVIMWVSITACRELDSIQYISPSTGPIWLKRYWKYKKIER